MHPNPTIDSDVGGWVARFLDLTASYRAGAMIDYNLHWSGRGGWASNQADKVGMRPFEPPDVSGYWR